MGKYNSSIYRVRPLMECIENDYDAFLSVLELLGISSLSKPTTYCYDGVLCSEKQLKPTKQHLLSLIDLMATTEHRNVKITGQNSEHLFFGDPDVRKATGEQAKAELEAHYDTLTSSSRPWYMFEGFTNPDIFIEGDDYVIVGEGKWTEPHITTTTTYLPSRNQMIRHIQGTLNYTQKKVYAFYIVDADCGYTNDLSKESFRQQLADETIQPDNSEKVAIVNAFYGFTTWQAIHEILPQINFPDKNAIK